MCLSSNQVPGPLRHIPAGHPERLRLFDDLYAFRNVYI
jgi:hypothetical protein